MAKKQTVRTFVRVKLRSPAGGVSFKDLPIEGKHANDKVEELHLVEIEEVETLLQKAVIGAPPELKVV